MTTLLIGASGQLGTELRQVFQDHDLVPLTHADLELTDRAQVGDALQKYRPGLILNTAAYHGVDECEDHPERSFAVNALAVRDLAIAAREIRAVLVHFSTDYVVPVCCGHLRADSSPPPSHRNDQRRLRCPRHSTGLFRSRQCEPAIARSR